MKYGDSKKCATCSDAEYCKNFDLPSPFCACMEEEDDKLYPSESDYEYYQVFSND